MSILLEQLFSPFSFTILSKSITLARRVAIKMDIFHAGVILSNIDLNENTRVIEMIKIMSFKRLVSNLADAS